MRDGCGLGCNEFAGRVQNNHVRFAFTEMAIISSSSDSKISEEVRHPCTFLVINIVLNVQIYMGAWAWKAKNNDVKGHACRTSSGKSCCRSGYCVAGYVKDTIVGAYHRTSDGRKHKIIGRAGPERDTIFHFMSQRAALATGKNTRLLGVLDQNET